MITDRLISRRGLIIVISIIAALSISLYLGFEPVTRHYLATDEVCGYCHVEREYLHTVRMSYTSIHPPAERIEAGVPEQLRDRVPAHCVDCHLPPGFVNTAFTYTHYLSITDLFGHFRDREGERAGDWIPLSAARSYRVRNRLQEYDSATCRTCHIMEEIVPETTRGKTAHKDAVANDETCIECHTNLVHRFVDVRVAEEVEAEAEEAVDEFGEEPVDEFEDAPEEGAAPEEEVL